MRSYSVQVATAVVVANMVGTGVFTSLGFQLLEIESTGAILWLWVLGGLCALCGALCYAELGAHHTASGGEYHFLTELIHPYAGFLSGCVSATVGFAAPIALASLTFGIYLATAFPALPPKITATTLIVLMVLIHTRTYRESSSGQYVLTLLKLLLIAAFVLTAFATGSDFSHQVTGASLLNAGEILSGAGAIALIYVTYAYSGWNAATYILGELEHPQRDLPRALIVGCALVTVLYVLLNTAFLTSASISSMTGEVEIAFIVAETVLGESGAFIVSLLLSGVLISTVSAMIMAGPRALQRLGQDYRGLAWLGKTNEGGLPANAIVFMGLVALGFLWTSTFEQILLFAGLVMAANTFFTVVAVFVSRRRRMSLPPGGSIFTMPWYPLPALIFLAITGWTVLYTAIQYPVQLLVTAAVIAVGYPFFQRIRSAQ
ncbi:MAG TPA: amino acid permease [Halieaceae bacterium]|nr:amino acid permease [Halieaceae bacterium]